MYFRLNEFSSDFDRSRNSWFLLLMYNISKAIDRWTGQCISVILSQLVKHHWCTTLTEIIAEVAQRIELNIEGNDVLPKSFRVEFGAVEGRSHNLIRWHGHGCDILGPRVKYLQQWGSSRVQLQNSVCLQYNCSLIESSIDSCFCLHLWEPLPQWAEAKRLAAQSR